MRCTKLVNSSAVAYPVFTYPEESDWSKETLYLNSVFNVLRTVEKPIVFIVRGLSMTMLSSILLWRLRMAGKIVRIEIIRKAHEQSHCSTFSTDNKMELLNEYYYCIVDDLIASGHTLVSVLSCIELHGNRKIDALFVSEILVSCLDDSRDQLISSSIKEIYCG